MLARRRNKLGLAFLDLSEPLSEEFPASLGLLDRHATFLELMRHSQQVNVFKRSTLAALFISYCADKATQFVED